MAFEIFGFRIGRPDEEKKKAEQIPSFAPRPNDDGTIDLANGGTYGLATDLETSAKTETELVTRYRELALQPEADRAIEELVNEAIVREDNKSTVEINLDNVNTQDSVKKKIRDEFREIKRMLNFDNMGYDIFRRWYVDGRIYYHMMIDEKKPREGIKELRYIDPRRIRKVREPLTRRPQPQSPSSSPAKMIVPSYNEYFLYIPTGVGPGSSNQGVRISKDSIAYNHSGILDSRNKMILSHLHIAIKPMNQLRMLEDASVIYRLARAPERRIFYIDVGNMPKMKAEQYLRDMMVKNKNRLVYDATTGQIRDDRKFMTMLEDFWLPRREGGKGTEITTLPGGQNLGEMTDVEYFRQKLYKSLRVPVSRINTETPFNMGRSGEITRDEIRFSKFVDRLRARFCELFDDIMEIQLVLKGVMSREEWKKMRETVEYDFLRDNYYAEIKDQEIMNARLSILQNVDAYVGKYFSAKYVREKVLHQTEEEMAQLDEEMASEALENPALQTGADGQPQQGNMPFDPAGAPPGAQPAAGASVPLQSRPLKPLQKPGPAGMGKKPKVNEEASEPQEQKVLTEEEKRLVESMTKLLDSITFEDGLPLDSDKKGS